MASQQHGFDKDALGTTALASSSRPWHGLTLVHLPPEVLGMIFAELDWKHILRARQTCRTLDSVSRSHESWYSIYQLISSDYDHPLPFAKHVSRMSASELESAVTRWLRVESGWLSKTKNPGRRTLGPRDEDWFHLVEGGRWLVAASLDHGCVSAYDLDATEDERYIIIRPENRLEQYGISDILVHVDTILPSLDLHIALVHSSLSPSRLSIWRVYDAEQEHYCQLSSTLVSSFNTHLDGSTTHAALHGDLIAQELLMVNSVVIVIHDWKRSSSFQQYKSFIFPARPFNILQFLPGRRLLAINEDCATIYAIPNWSHDLPSDSIPTPPLHAVSLRAYFCRGMSPTYRDYAGNTQVLLGTWVGICRLVIPSHDKPSVSIQVPAITNRCHYFAVGTHRALIIIHPNRYTEMMAFTVKFCQGAPVRGQVRAWPTDHRHDYQPLIDEISGRIVEISKSRHLIVSDYSI